MPRRYPKSRRYFGYSHNFFQRMDVATTNPAPPPTSIHITADANHDHAIIAAALTFTHHDHPLIRTFVEDDDVTCVYRLHPPPSPNTRLIVVSPPTPHPPFSRPPKWTSMTPPMHFSRG